MASLPPLILGDFQYVPRKNKPVLLLFPTGDVAEFSTIESAQTYLHYARMGGGVGAEQTALFYFDGEAWQHLA